MLADQHFQNLLSSVGFINFCLDHFSLKEKEKKPPKKPTKTLCVGLSKVFGAEASLSSWAGPEDCAAQMWLQGLLTDCAWECW